MRGKTLAGIIFGGYFATCCLLEVVAPMPRPDPVAVVDPEKATVVTLGDKELPDEISWYIEDLPLPFQEQEYLWNACQEFGVDHSLMLALIEQETNFRNVTGDGGDSIGYCQIQPRWWSGLMEEIGADDLTDPQDNFRTGCAIMAHLLERYGTTEDALSAYNSGGPGPTVYAASVLSAEIEWERRSLMTTKKLAVLLRWAQGRVDAPLAAVYTVGDTLRLQLRDGRAGVLYLEDGKPCLMLPAEI